MNIWESRRNSFYGQKLYNFSEKLLKSWSIKLFGEFRIDAEIEKGLKTGFTSLGLTEDEVKLAVPTTLIVITAILTATGTFSKIAKYAGAGTAVPITGFANSVVSPAVEFSTEGKILGTGAKMFNLAGPVIVYGCSAASLYGLIYYLFLK